MKIQRNYSQFKKQENSSEIINNEMEITSLPDSIQKVVIKMVTKLRKIIDINADQYNTELETIKMNQPKADNSICEIKSNETRSNE